MCRLLDVNPSLLWSYSGTDSTCFMICRTSLFTWVLYTWFYVDWKISGLYREFAVFQILRIRLVVNISIDFGETSTLKDLS